jgi:hypothetical protein
MNPTAELRGKMAVWDQFDGAVSGGRGRSKTAGEVVFTKGWEKETLLSRNLVGSDWKPDARNLRVLAQALWSLSMAFGHIHTGTKMFSKIKSSTISPDGKLGGRGYIKPITKIRTKLHEAVEILSDVTDTLQDELSGPHWTRQRETLPKQENDEISALVEEAQDVSAAPEKTIQTQDESEVADAVEREVVGALRSRVKSASRVPSISRTQAIAVRISEMFMDRRLAPMHWEDPEQPQPQWSNPTGSAVADFMKVGPDDDGESDDSDVLSV